jgi:hypothetical protein
MGKTFSGCAEQDKKQVDRLKIGEGIGQGKLGGIGMMGGWMEAGAHPSIGVKLIISFPSSAYSKG